jgi:manganese-dependent inorganic pyrophosphatase
MKETKPIYTIGHRNPDTDSICSAIGYAHLKSELGENVVAARAGKINAETKFVLEHFNLPQPLLITDLYPRVKDITLDCKTVVKETDNLRKLGAIMREQSLKSVPVVDANQNLVGIVTVSDLAQRYFQELSMQNLSEAKIALRDIIAVVDGEVIVNADQSVKVEGNVRIAAGSSRMIEKIVKKNDVVLIGDRTDEAIFECIKQEIACLIVTGSGRVSADVVEEAEAKHTLIISTPYDTYTCARLINQCVPVSRIMQKNITAFKPTDMLSDIKGTMEATNFRNYPVVENGRLVGLVSRDQLMVPEKDRVILVDHNERNQAVEGIEEVKVVEIIDHHRLGGIQTSEPIFARQEPVGSTATIVANLYAYYNVEIPKHIAGVLLSAILSDTVLFKSPTCTPYDKKTAEKLAAIAGLDIQTYGIAMLKAGSGIGNMTPAEITKNDLKEFQIGDYRIIVSQISVMDTAEVLALQEQLLDSMKDICEKEGYDMSLVMVTDIIKEGTWLLYTGNPKTLIGEAFKKDASGNALYLPGVMSRKKQIIPPLSEAAKKYAM